MSSQCPHGFFPPFKVMLVAAFVTINWHVIAFVLCPEINGFLIQGCFVPVVHLMSLTRALTEDESACMLFWPGDQLYIKAFPL